MLLVDSLEKMQLALEFIAGSEILAYDIETTGLNPRKDTIIGFGVSNALDGFYVPLYTYKNKQLIRIGLSAYDVRILLNALATKKLLAFNAAFDLPFTKNYFGVDLLPALDTDVLLLKHTCDEEFPLDLKGIGKKLFGVDAIEEKEVMKASIKANGGTATEYYKADMQTIAAYCVKDCLLTYRIYNYYKPQLIKQGLYKFFYQDEVMPLYKEVTIPMEAVGVKMDVRKMQKTLEEINAHLQVCEDGIQFQIKPLLDLFITWFLNKDYPMQTATGKTPAWAKKYASQYDAWRAENEGYMFNLLSKHHLKKLFFDTLKETPTSTTDLGNPQVDEEFLELMAKKYDWCKELIVYNKLTKIKSTYIERFLEEIEGDVFYPRFQQHRTVSGRYAGDLQQLPRPLEDGDYRVVKYTNLIREFIIARPGCKLISCDYEQLEPTVFAHTSQDPALQAIFNNGLDFYSEIAIKTERLEGVSSDKKALNYLGKIDKAKRQKAKAYSLGIAYGMTGYKLQFEIGVPQEEAEQLVKDYLNAFPGLNAWINKSHDEAKFNGFVRTQTGRIRHLEQAKRLHAKYGTVLMDSLALWKLYNTVPSVYAQAKEDRQTMKNLLNNAVNVQVQGLAASIVNQASIAIARAKLPCNILGQVHDELIFECQEQHVDAVCKAVKQIMESNIKLSTPLRTVPQVGTNYRECK